MGMIFFGVVSGLVGCSKNISPVSPPSSADTGNQVHAMVNPCPPQDNWPCGCWGNTPVEPCDQTPTSGTETITPTITPPTDTPTVPPTITNTPTPTDTPTVAPTNTFTPIPTDTFTPTPDSCQQCHDALHGKEKEIIVIDTAEKASAVVICGGLTLITDGAGAECFEIAEAAIAAHTAAELIKAEDDFENCLEDNLCD